MSEEYNVMELMTILASRDIEDKKIIYVGTGIPMLVTSLAQKSRNLKITPIFEVGGIGPEMPTLPLSVACSRTTWRALRCADSAEAFEIAQAGFADYAFLGGAQIDKYGNLNSTVLGDYHAPKVRFPGSGGANAFASLAWKTMIIMNHEKRRFVEKTDYITSPGYLNGPGSREKAGLPPGTGPYKVYTTRGTFDFDDKTKRMRVFALNPGVTVDDVIENTGFELVIPSKIRENEPPSREELKILREEVDPYRIILGRGEA
jgi:glutaconate CoA-transferase subunit B